MGKLSGEDRKYLRKLIQSRFLRDDFALFLLEGLEQEMHLIVSEQKPYPIQIGAILTNAIQKNWVRQLVYALVNEGADAEKKLYELANKLELNSVYDTDYKRSKNGLERLVNESPFLNISAVIYQLAKIEARVCRIQIEKDNGTIGWGTGFLIGPDLLLSNYHVFEYIIENPEAYNKVECLFDFKVAPDGTKIFDGTPFGLKQDPIVAQSPYSKMDVNGDLLEADWPLENLDYAVVRLDKPVGNMPYGVILFSGLESDNKRGWLKLPTEEIPSSERSHSLIIQHPNKKPMQVVFGFEKLLELSPNKARIRYNVNTMSGSSGSPVLNEKFELIALHNMGDPAWNATYNQGIPAWLIAEDLINKGIIE